MKRKYMILIVLFLLVPCGVKADLCEVKQANTKYKFCLKTDARSCFETETDFPDNLADYNITETRYCKNSGYELRDNLCVQKENCDSSLKPDANSVNVELTTKSGVCNADAELNKDFRLELKVGQYASCEGPVDLVCKATVSIDSNYKFYFNDYESGQPIKSLVDSSKKTQYAVGTGTTFDVIYGSNIKYTVKYDQEVIRYTTTGWSTCQSCNTECSPDPNPKPDIPKTCSNKTNVSASQMGCTTTCTDYPCCKSTGYGEIDCREKMQISVDAIEASSPYVKVKYVNTETPTSKGNEKQYMGVLKDSGTKSDNSNKSAMQSFLFNPPSAFINLKTGQILYKGINYNGQNTNSWKEVTPGYYIPTNAIPLQNSVVSTEIGGTAYIIKVNGNEYRKIDVTGKLDCDFTTKISGCPYQSCGDATCNPETDQYKCCRNSNYLKKHPDYYVKSCGGQEDYVYRQIDLMDPFPKRIAGENWHEWISKEENVKKLKESFEGEPNYTFELTNNMISRIREYNTNKSNSYTLWNEMNDDGSSNFLKDGTASSISIGNNLKINSNYYSIGCGPSNETRYEWCK